jgi:hypothetical protein
MCIHVHVWGSQMRGSFLTVGCGLFCNFLSVTGVVERFRTVVIVFLIQPRLLLFFEFFARFLRIRWEWELRKSLGTTAAGRQRASIRRFQLPLRVVSSRRARAEPV